MIQGSRRRFRLICSANGYARQRIAEGVGVTRPDDLPLVAALDLVKAVRPRENVSGFQNLDCSVHGVAATASLSRYRVIAWEALACAGIVEAPQEGLQNVEKRPCDGAVRLPGAFVLGVVSARVGHDSRLGVAVERNSGTGAE